MNQMEVGKTEHAEDQKRSEDNEKMSTDLVSELQSERLLCSLLQQSIC